MLLFVCRANICRSPMAERLARLAFSGKPPRTHSTTISAQARTPGPGGSRCVPHGTAAVLGANPARTRLSRPQPTGVTADLVILVAALKVLTSDPRAAGVTASGWSAGGAALYSSPSASSAD